MEQYSFIKHSAVIIFVALSLVAYSESNSSTQKNPLTESISSNKKLPSNKGLPDYEENSPFMVTDKTIHRKLGAALVAATSNIKDCKVGEVDIPNIYMFPFNSNICKDVEFLKIRKLVSELAPTLDERNLTFWKEDLDEDGAPELIVGHIDISKSWYPKYPNFGRYPYLSLWLLKLENDIYKATYGGSYLGGKVHTFKKFGPNQKNKVLFVKLQSCIECHAWLYMTAIDFLHPTTSAVFEFTYSKDHSKFDSVIEYLLPGVRHSVEAKILNRIPPYNPNGPHLIQHFDFKEGKNEWFVFTCKGIRCDYELFNNKLPVKYEGLWNNGENLEPEQ